MGTARSFDGSNTIVAATVAAIDVGDWTFAAWVYPHTTGEATFGYVFENAVGTVQGISFNSNSRDLWAKQGFTGAHATTTTATGALALDAWACVFVTYRDSDKKMRIFIGTQSAPVADKSSSQTAGTAVRQTGATALSIGNNSALTRTWDGGIASVVFDAREWSLAEMEYFRQTGRPPSFASLRGWWPLEGTRSDEPDRSGLAAAATVTTPASPAFTTGPTLWLPRKVRPRRLVAR